MKKFVTCLCVFALVLSFAPLNAFAEIITSTDSDEISVLSLNDETIYSYENCEKRAIITVVNDTSVLISYLDKSDDSIIYELTTDLDNFSRLNNSTTFVNQVIAFMEANLSNAKMICGNVVNYETSDELLETNVRGAVLSDVYSFLVQQHGERYENRSIHSQTYQGLSCAVKERMVFRADRVRTYSWIDTVSVSTAILGVGLAVSHPFVSAICGWYGVASAAGSLLPAGGTIERYDVKVFNQRYVLINGSSYNYNTATKLTTYTAIDNATAGNIDTATINSSGTVTFVESASYYNSMASQYADAYYVYQQIGQQP